jgi:uncharacterized protein
MKMPGFAKPFTLVLLLGLLVGQMTPARAQDMSAAGNPIIFLRLNKTVVQAEVVSTPEKLQLGLGGRKSLAPESGMLFILPDHDFQEFWMQGMLIPIDIIWVSQEKIIGFNQNLSPKDSGTFRSPAPVDMVLEVPAGFVKAAGLKVGDRVERL